MASISFAGVVASKLHFDTRHVRGVLSLHDQGSTVPFITRYRQDSTGGMDEDQIRSVIACAEQCTKLEDKRNAALEFLSSPDCKDMSRDLVHSLRKALNNCQDSQEVDELIAPYRAKKCTSLAAKARALGLASLAEAVWDLKVDDRTFYQYVREHEHIANKDSKTKVDKKTIMEGVAHIIAEMAVLDPTLRNQVCELDEQLHIYKYCVCYMPCFPRLSNCLPAKPSFVRPERRQQVARIKSL
jgi:uncharacterized protein